MVSTTFLTINLIKVLLPSFYLKLATLEGWHSNMSKEISNPADYAATLVSWEGYKVILHTLYCQTKMTVKKGLPAPVTHVASIKDLQQHCLLDFERPGRPLVVSFGSVTCPAFRSHLQTFKQAITGISDIADFVMVYSLESHPEDEWRFLNSPYKLYQQKTLEERVEAAQILKTEYDINCELVVDTMDNESAMAFGALPNRLFVIVDGVVGYMGGMGPWGYKVGEVVQFVKDWDHVKDKGRYSFR